jgi:RNA polymerase sigma factor (sigma-70 family)
MLAIDFGADDVVVIAGRLDAASVPRPKHFDGPRHGDAGRTKPGAFPAPGWRVTKTQKGCSQVPGSSGSRGQQPSARHIIYSGFDQIRNRTRTLAPSQPFRIRRIVDNDADLALVARCRKGDWSAFTDLVVRYQRPIYNAAFWMLRRPEDAKDITQTVFLKVAERLHEFDPKFKFFSWIYRIAVNESLNLLRRNGREEALDASPAEGDNRSVPRRRGIATHRGRTDAYVDERSYGIDVKALFGVQLPRDRRDSQTRRKDCEIQAVRGAATASRAPGRPTDGLT